MWTALVALTQTTTQTIFHSMIRSLESQLVLRTRYASRELIISFHMIFVVSIRIISRSITLLQLETQLVLRTRCVSRLRLVIELDVILIMFSLKQHGVSTR